MDICADDLIYELVKITSEIRINTSCILLPEFIRLKIFIRFFTVFVLFATYIHIVWVNKIFEKINVITYSKETT